jgi:hypothetical protein
MIPLAFIDQPKGKIQGKADKKRVRQHAMNHSVTNRGGGKQAKKRAELVELEIPEGFGDSGVGELKGNEEGEVQIEETADIEAATGRMMEVVVGLERQLENQARVGDETGQRFVAGGSQLVFENESRLSGGLRLLAPKETEISSEASDTSGRRSRGRAFAPKVRTGCKACK